MKPFALRILEVPTGGARTQRVMTAYLHRREIRHQQFGEELVSLLSAQAGFDYVLFVGQEQQLLQARQWMSEGAIRDRLSQATARAVDTITYFACFEGQTRQLRITGLSGASDLPTDFVSRVRRASLIRIFRESDALVDAPQGTHYEKPSGKHTAQFLRVARVLESHLHVSEIAFWLLPTIAQCESISQILVDTSGILSIGYVLAYECVHHGWLCDVPLVTSHNSYQGLSSLAVRDPASTLCLISASTSGELEERLSALGIPDRNIVTLYLLGHRSADTREILCDLTRSEPDNPNGYAPIDSYSGDACQLCARRSLPVKVSGDQFVLEQPVVREIDIRKTDLTQRDTLDALAGTGTFKVFRVPGPEEFEIFLDIEALLAPGSQVPEYQPTAKLRSDLRAKINAYIRRGLPVHARRVVHGSHPYSKQLAEAAAQTFRQFQNGTTIDVVSAQELSLVERVPETASLVIGACFTGAQELTTINMLLRGVQPQGNTTYVALTYRCECKAERDRVRTTVTFGEFESDTFNFYSALCLYLPNCARQHSWHTELELLISIQHQAQIDGIDVPPTIEARIDSLRAAPRTGLEDDLFWPSASGSQLRIQPDFVFLNTKDRIARISQADIYVAVASVLHDLRQRSDDRQLVHGPYKRSLLASDNFRRFNDPVVQAALLRAARGYELSYANCQEDRSLNAKRIVDEAILAAESRKPECLMEFLLALACKRMTLFPEHTRAVCEKVLEAELPAAYRLVAKHVLSELP